MNVLIGVFILGEMLCGGALYAMADAQVVFSPTDILKRNAAFKVLLREEDLTRFGDLHLDVRNYIHWLVKEEFRMWARVVLQKRLIFAPEQVLLRAAAHGDVDLVSLLLLAGAE